jgi:hypothetical protein
LQQAVHGRGERKVGGDRFDRALLVSGEREGQAGVERRNERPVDLVLHADRLRG